MASRSFIGISLPSGRVKAVYCHYDGYPEHHAPILLNHYDTAAKVRKLMQLGSLSTLGKEIGLAHNFDSHWSNPDSQEWCLSYFRDRGEPRRDSGPSILQSPFDMDHQFNYLFKDNQWWMVDGNQLVDLRTVFITELFTS